MSIHTKGTRVFHVTRKSQGTIARDTPAHSVVYVRWDGETAEQPYLPECIAPVDQQSQHSKDAWSNARGLVKK